MMPLQLDKTPENIQKVVEKINLYIVLYAKKHHIYKYIKLSSLYDESGISYKVFDLNIEKIFVHTSFFKNCKKKLNMLDSNGEKTHHFYDNMSLWVNDKHKDYCDATSIRLKLFNKSNENDKENSEITVEDLKYLNTLYRKLKK